MTANIDEMRHRFAKSNPEFLAAWRICGSAVVILTTVLIVLRQVDVVPNYGEVLWWELFIVVFGLTCLGIWILPRRLGDGVRICPEYLLIQKWPANNRAFLPWEDIDSIRLESWQDRNRLDRMYAVLAFGNQSTTPYVVVRTRKMVNVPFVAGRTTTNRLGFPLGKVFRLYVEDAAEFVQKAQQNLGRRDPPG
jgi:hypothetical protein